jgi:conserved oligomeric Golgi complex subunit 6
MGGAEDDSATIERALDSLVDPAVRMCVTAAGEKDAALRRQAAPGPAWDRPVFVLNCLTYLVDTLAPYPCAARKRAELDSAVEARVLELIEEHVQAFPPFSHFLANFLILGSH